MGSIINRKRRAASNMDATQLLAQAIDMAEAQAGLVSLRVASDGTKKELTFYALGHSGSRAL